MRAIVPAATDHVAARAFVRFAREVALAHDVKSAFNAFCADPSNARILEKAAVSPATFEGWSALTQATGGAYLAAIRARGAFGQMTGLRSVPLDTKVPTSTGAATAGWLAEGQALRFSAGAFDTDTLVPRKLTAAIALEGELVRLGGEAALNIIDGLLADAIATATDTAFLDPAQAATDSAPASITNAAVVVPATASTAAGFRTDSTNLVAAMVAAGGQLAQPYWIMSPAMRVSLALADGGLIRDGRLAEIPVLTTLSSATADGNSPAAERIFLIDAAAVMVGDEGVEIDSATHATVELNTAPDSPTTASTVQISLWQHDRVGIRARRFLNWTALNAGAAGYISNASYGR